jgi:hypothetical protein
VRTSLIVLLLMLLSVTGSLSAQERMPEPLVSAAAVKSGSRARLLSIAHTAVATSAGFALMRRGGESDVYGVPGYWLFAYGTLAAPSAGNFYAGDRARVNTGLNIRTIGAALIVTSMWKQIFSSAFDIDNPDGGEFHWDALNVTGTGVVVAGATYSVITIPASVEKYNRNSAVAAAPRVSITPSVLPEAGKLAVQLDVHF